MFKSKAIILAVLVFAIGLIASTAFAQIAPSPCAVDFYKKVIGDWVGTYEHTTDGAQAEDIYFKFSLKQTDPTSFTGEFAYYRSGPTGGPEPAGNATIQSTVQADGTVRNVISGDGTIMIDNDLKQQSYDLVETLSISTCGLNGAIGGKVSVAGLPFGVGKNGQVNSGTSIWTLDGDTLTIKQTIKAGFKVLLFSKSYALLANSTAVRGTDVAAIMKKPHIAQTTAPSPPVP